MTKAAKKTQDTLSTREHILDSFDALVATAGVDGKTAALARDGADPASLDEALTHALQLTHDRWGLGLLHLTHAARLVRGDQDDVMLLVDGREVARLSQGAAAIAATYEGMRAQNADDLSDWGVLPEGHRAALKSGGQLRALIEDARDFETHWTAERGGAFARTWRRGDVLAVEVHRPASPGTALADAAWDAITSIKNRQLQRELMERSNSAGMLGALLAARHRGAARQLDRLPEAHFTVRSSVVRASASEARDFERHKAMLREGAAQLDDLQQAGTKRLAELLSSGLK